MGGTGLRYLVEDLLLRAAFPTQGGADELAIRARELSATSAKVAAEYPDFGNLNIDGLSHAVHYFADKYPEEYLPAAIDLSGELTTLFCRSYENLVSRDWVKVFRENDPKTGDASPIPPYTLGSHASRLVQLLRQGHESVRLSREEFIRLVTWIDANAPYYGRRNLKYQTHPDFRPIPTMETRR